MKFGRINTAKYSVLQSLYWIAFSLVVGYSSVYLLDLGFTSSKIGVMLSVSNLISAVLQQIIGAITDRSSRIRLELLVGTGFALAAAMAIMVYLFSGGMTAVTVLYVMLMVCGFSVAPSLNSMAFSASERNVNVNYGFARGMGSLSYALTSATAGYVFERLDTKYIPVFFGAAFLLATVVAMFSRVPVRDGVQEDETLPMQEDSSRGFMRRYIREFALLLGAILIFYDHMVINNFAKQLTMDIGGTTSQMGIVIFIAALVEFPVMLFFTKLKARIDCAYLLRIAAVMFVVKHGLTFAATTMTMLYIAAALQICSYALFITALLYYFKQVMSGRDLGKGQALANNVITVSGIFASASGGFMIDNLGMRNTLAVGLVLSVLGAVVVWFAVRIEKKAQ